VKIQVVCSRGVEAGGASALEIFFDFSKIWAKF